MSAAEFARGALLQIEARARAPLRLDAQDIAQAVAATAIRAGCTESNAHAAIAWALRVPDGLGTLAAVRSGSRRAAQLSERQGTTTPPHSAA